MKSPGLKIWQIYSAGGLTCAVVTLCAWYFLAGPALAARAQERDLRIETLARHRQLPKLTALLTVTRRQATAIHQALDQTHISLQPTSSLNERLARMESLAAGCGVAFDEVRPGEAVAGSHYQSLPIHLRGSASYPACTEFLRQLHGTMPDMGVKSVDLGASGNSTKSNSGTFRFELIWYARK